MKKKKKKKIGIKNDYRLQNILSHRNSCESRRKNGTQKRWDAAQSIKDERVMRHKLPNERD